MLGGTRTNADLRILLDLSSTTDTTPDIRRRKALYFAPVLKVDWSMAHGIYPNEAGGDPSGYFDSLEGMARAHGRSPTSSWLLVTLFCDIFEMDPGVYIHLGTKMRTTGGARRPKNIALHST